MSNAAGYAAQSATSPIRYFDLQRREPGPDDVEIDILFCGVCHSDLHYVRGEWGPVPYPAAPGHEIVGRVTRVGKDVTKLKVGDMAGVGCIVDSCLSCSACKEDLENYCETGMIGTYGGVEKQTGLPTQGGYTSKIVVRDHHVLKVPEGLDPAAAAPLLCAGITTYSPLRHWKVGPGHKVGVVGLGGLGHMAVKLAAAMGAEVTLFTTSPDKVADGKALGATNVVISKDPEQMQAVGASLDFIINTVAAPHSLDPFLAALKRDGVMTLVGVPSEPHPSPSVFGLIMKRRSLAGSMIGGIAETQEMLDFCAEKGIGAEIEVIPIQEINTAFDRMLNGKVKYRFVIDMQSLKDEAAKAA
ncbi:MAG: NAD(P)-dependent alcohol dehydrogenase [Caulobacterales bacterium]|nr:NAD(P)-dependent alcohol dehydrogenase [Caulobacterales bacterium]